VELECGAIIYNYTDSIQWTKDGSVLDNSNGIEVQSSHTEFSWRQKLIFREIMSEHSGEYNCEVSETGTDEQKTLSASIRVHDAVPPAIVTNFNQSTITRPFGELLTLDCYVSGLPVPTLVW
jgi:hypothetical protein